MWLSKQPKECQMDYEQLSMVADKFQWVFSELLLNACGKEAKFCRRERLITPFRLGLALTATSASQQVETLTDFHRSFNALWGTQVSYEAFYKQLAKPQFAELARTLSERLISDMSLKVFGFTKGRAFGEFRRLLIQDGTSFAIHNALREVFPGRFKTVKPAAVELHTTMELLCDAPTTVVLPPDTTSEQAFVPEPTSLCTSLLLADRGDSDLHYLRRVQDAGGFFIIRAKAGMNPQVCEAFREDGKRLRSLRNKPLQTIHTKLPKRQRVELGVRWDVDGCPLCLRLIVSWNRRTKSFCYLLTNLPPKRYPLEGICRAYNWRGQVELLFKEWKSYANLHAFDTEKVAIVEGLIWAAIAAAALKRFLAHATQLIAGVAMSTRKAAMCVTYVLSDIVQALKTAHGAALNAALMSAVTYLACHARRAHPQRDRQIGRCQLGLEPLFGNNDAAEIREAA
jgi:DDE family transposase